MAAAPDSAMHSPAADAAGRSAGTAAATPAAAPEAAVPEAEVRTVLHVGCGPANPAKLHAHFRSPGWREVRLDIDPRVAPDIVASITGMTPVADASVDAVWSSHNLEHLEAHQVPLALGEFLRVLKPGGFLLITLPDLQAVAAHVAADNLEEPLYQAPAGPIAAIDILFGFRRAIAQGNGFMAHRTGFTATTLARHLRLSGFTNIRTERRKFDLWAVAHRPVIPQASA
jgi:SAM-dependent methyltransferase